MFLHAGDDLSCFSDGFNRGLVCVHADTEDNNINVVNVNCQNCEQKNKNEEGKVKVKEAKWQVNICLQ